MTAVGRAPRDRLVTSGGARPGDTLILTKAAAMEGTAILATDLAAHLQGRVAPELLARAQGLTARLSVVRDGVQAAELGATALHDPTEGGILGALWEMAEASGYGFEVDASAVPILEETRQICAVFGADPLKLISSGAMLIACPSIPRHAGRPRRAPDPGHPDRPGHAARAGRPAERPARPRRAHPPRRALAHPRSVRQHGPP